MAILTQTDRRHSFTKHIQPSSRLTYRRKCKPIRLLMEGVVGKQAKKRTTESQIKSRSTAKPTPRVWATIPKPSYHLTSLEHINCMILSAPQGYKVVSEETCRCLATIGKLDLGIALQDLPTPHPAQLKLSSSALQLPIAHAPKYSTADSPPLVPVSTSTMWQDLRFDPYIRPYIGEQRALPLRPVPIQYKAAAHYFESNEWGVPLDRTFPPEGMVCFCDFPSEPKHAAACKNFMKGFKDMEAKLIIRVYRWYRDILLPQFVNSTEHFATEIRDLPVKAKGDWNGAGEGLQKQALIRFAELIRSALLRIDDGAEDEKEGRELRMTEERMKDPRLTTRKGAREVQAEMEIEKELMSLLVPEDKPSDHLREDYTAWNGIREFCKLLRSPFARRVAEIWELIIEYHYGLTVDQILDPALL